MAGEVEGPGGPLKLALLSAEVEARVEAKDGQGCRCRSNHKVGPAAGPKLHKRLLVGTCHPGRPSPRTTIKARPRR